ncbi:hypothetical protein QVD17_03538 [Tagetes erecta]|uniref:Peptidase C1A papain C-terminal domain-containing protein n=1 Tax=Tagetes erecta TaxID=13708 RepID=A0AAD8LHP2_TARER|nr:hypothetical protein QVD17_03538 [Tagetes erecta]
MNGDLRSDCLNIYRKAIRINDDPRIGKSTSMSKNKSMKHDQDNDDYEFSWVTQGVVTDVKLQVGDLCWAFAVMAAIESLILIVTGELYNLSVQHLVGCDDLNHGLERGNPKKAFQYLMDIGGKVYSAEDYKFTGEKGECACDNVSVTDHITVTFSFFSNERVVLCAVYFAPGIL